VRDSAWGDDHQVEIGSKAEQERPAEPEEPQPKRNRLANILASHETKSLAQWPGFSPKRSSRSLRENAVGNRVVVIGGVIADCEPAAIRFQRIGCVAFLVRSEVLPGVVALQGEKLPGSAL